MVYQLGTGIRPSVAWTVHMLQMCFYDIAITCTMQNCATMESGLAVVFFFFLAIPFTSKSNGGPFGRFQLTISILGLFDLAVRERETEAEKNKKQKTELEHKSRKE
jgi:hypothetical protein